MDQDNRGWTNYQTFLVNLWLCNEETEYTEVVELARRHYHVAKANCTHTREQQAARELSWQLREELGDAVDRVTQQYGLFRDLLSHSLREVNWEEIAMEFIEEVAAPCEASST